MGAVLQTYYRKRSPTDSGFQALQTGVRLAFFPARRS